MKKITLLVLITIASALNVLLAQHEINAGEVFIVPPLQNVLMPEGIIIHDGGQLLINQGFLRMGEGTEIIIEDGGKLTAIDGLISNSGTTHGNWSGIVVESGVPNSNLAVDINGTLIQLADIAIHVKDDIGHARRIRCENTDFFANSQHNLYFWGGSLNSPNGSEFIGCNFLSFNNQFWPIKFGYANDITFTNCSFFGTPRYHLHFDQTKDLLIQGCTFDYDQTALGLHYVSQDIKIRGNEFICSAPNSFEAIELGYEGSSSSPLQNVLISHNDFTPNVGGYGIKAGGGSYQLSDLRISVNNFHGTIPGAGFEACIDISNASGNLNRINGNSIIGGEYGVYSHGDNSNLLLSCNAFDNNNYHIYNVDVLSAQSQTGIDPNNKFFTTPDFDIFSDSYTLYYYLNGFPGATTPNINYNTVILSSQKKQRCKRIFDDGARFDSPVEQEISSDFSDNKINLDRLKRNHDSIILYPNPTDNYLNIHSPVNSPLINITIFNSLGQSVKRYDLGNNKKHLFNADILNLPQGNYWCKAGLETGEIITLPFSVQR